jgi:ATP-dependent helicase HepA
MLVCHPGQRWVSRTEPELGLGIVLQVANRRAAVSFPAAEEERTYSTDDAPLVRVEYLPGDQIKTDAGEWITVTVVASLKECFIYSCLTELDEKVQLHEKNLDSSVQFAKPLERVFIGQFEKSSKFNLRSLTLHHKHTHQRSSLYGFLGPRIERLPHQLYIANEVANREFPRVLLADEVGLGKTIEAGLVLHRMLLDGRVTSALVVVPDQLVFQWFIEMRRKFNLDFSIAEQQDFLSQVQDEEQSSAKFSQLTLVPQSYLTSNDQNIGQLLEQDWDLLIVDEAHHLKWAEGKAGEDFQAIEKLAAVIPSLILLTATPLQLGIQGHFGRLKLLDPNRYADLEKYIEEEEGYQNVSLLIGYLEDLESEPIDSIPQNFLIDLEKILDLTHIEDSSKLSSTTLIKDLQDQHGTGRVLFRNTRKNIGSTNKRKLIEHSLTNQGEYRKAIAELRSNQEQLYPEINYSSSWTTTDPRSLWLSQWLKENPNLKTLCICAHTSTAIQLEKWLKLTHGIKSGVFHSELTLVQRDRAAAYFSDHVDGAQILVCSEIGSEGRNFQFAHNLVLFDLPYNPDLLEQRIGRLDRIGQTETINIHVPVIHGTAQKRLLDWFHQGINAIESTCPTGTSLFDEFFTELESILWDQTASLKFKGLIKATAIRKDHLLEENRAGRDRLIELNSFDKKIADELMFNIEKQTRSDELKVYMDCIFDEFGVDSEDDVDHCIVLHPGDHMAYETFPHLPHEGVSGTFSHKIAKSRDDLQFFTWEHPMVLGAMELLLNSGFGNSACSVVTNTKMIKGSIALEAIYVVVCPAPANLRIERYFSESIIRILINNTGSDIHQQYSSDWLARNTTDIPEITAQKVVNQVRTQLEKLTKVGETKSQEKSKNIITMAKNEITRQLESEIIRLKRLAKINKSIRSIEIKTLEIKLSQSLAFMENTYCKLDSLRILIAT